MAEINFNPETGLFDAVDPEGEVIYDGSVNDVGQDTTDTVSDTASSLDGQEETPQDGLEDEEIMVTDVDGNVLYSGSYDFVTDLLSTMMPMSVVDNDVSFTPRDWQVNIAQSRGMGEHYLLWAVRQSSGYSRWIYYLAVGKDIEFSNDVYTYNHVDLYSYCDNGSNVEYELSEASGSVDGNMYLVYSDLYFDYVPAPDSESPFIGFFVVAFFLIFTLLLFSRRK